MDKKILLGMALLIIGIIILPETVALFSGQHNWYDTIPDGNQIPCQKCHVDIFLEMNDGTSGTVNAFHLAENCEGCHITAPISKGLTMGGAEGNDFHAAASPACLDCHDGTLAVDARSIITGPAEVHKAFVNESERSFLLKGSNEACVGCHTHVAVNITWSRATTLEFNSTETVLPDGNHSWIVENFTATGRNVTKTSADGEGNPI